jgi:hypothetical protein
VCGPQPACAAVRAATRARFASDTFATLKLRENHFKNGPVSLRNFFVLIVIYMIWHFDYCEVDF